MALLLALAVAAGGAPAGVSAAQPSTVSFTSTPPPDPVVGGPAYTPTASNSDQSGPAPTISVDATATTNAACTLDGGLVSFQHAGSCVLDATAPASGTTPEQDAQQSFVVAPATTSTVLVIAAGSLSATVTAVAPGTGTPEGTVDFSVAGRVLGSASLAGGVATLDYSVPANVSETILASYQGEADYTGSSATKTVSGPNIEPTFVAEPTIAAVLTSSAPKNRYGWWHTAVRVHFVCHGAGSRVLGRCPRAIVLDRSGAKLTLSRTIHTASGKRAAVTLRGLKIDLTRPSVTIAGIRDHARYRGRGPAVRCAARDRVSGIRSCRLTSAVRRAGGIETITYTAIATSWAGSTVRSRETVYVKL